MERPSRARVSDLHAHLVCVLCGGYYVDATTIVECLHTFCRSCIVRYLESSKFCPMCDVQVHKTRPLLNLRADKTLQDLVYKVVPGSYSTEMQRRREYYAKLEEKNSEEAQCSSSEERGEPETPEFFSPEDSISLSLEYYTGEESGGEEGEAKPEGEPAKEELDIKRSSHKRYLQCPAAVGMRHLKKFIRLKYGLSQDYKVDIIYEGECLREEFTLMDVAYTFNWKRSTSMRFSYRIYERPRIVHLVGVTSADRTISDNNGGEEPPVKRPRLLSSDNAGSGASASSGEQKGQAPSQGGSAPSEDGASAEPAPSPVPQIAEREEKHVSRPRTASSDSKPRAPVEGKSPSRAVTETKQPPRAASESKPPPRPAPESKPPPRAASETKPPPRATESKPPPRPKTPKEKKEPRPDKRDSPAPSTSKTISQPPKPIMPGQKPPSQTALLLQQRILEQRQQQQKMQLQKQQQQQKMQMQKQQQMNNMQQQKQIPSLQKLQTPLQKQQSQMKLNRPISTSPSTVNKIPAASSTQTTSKPSVQTSSSKHLTPPLKKPVPASTAIKSVPTPPITKPSVPQNSGKPVQTPVSNGKPSVSPAPAGVSSVPKASPSTPKPVPSAPKPLVSTPKPAVSTPKPAVSTPKPSVNLPKPSPSSETRRDDSGLIDKNKMRPVVVIERHSKKQSPSLEKSSSSKDKSATTSKPPKPAAIPPTTLSVAPGGSATKLRLVKRPATSPAGSPPPAKKLAESPKVTMTPLTPLEIRGPGDEPRHDDFGALDLSGKSSRKSDSPCSSHSSGAASPPAPSPPEPPRTSPALKITPSQPRVPTSNKTTKSQSPQTSIMSIAQTLVNRQLSNLGFNGEGGRSPNSPHSQGSSSPSSQGSSGGGTGLSFRNLMTLSDTAVQVQRNSMSTPQRVPTPQPRMRPPGPQQHQQVSSGGPRPSSYGRGTTVTTGNMRSPPPPAPIRIPSVPTMNKTLPPRTESNGPMMSPNRVPRLNDLFSTPPGTKPGPNQSVRHIPNPSLLFRQQANRMQQQQQLLQQSLKDEITITPARNPTGPPLSSIRKIENLTRNIGEGKGVAAGMGARAEATQ